MLKVRVGECVDTQVDQGVDGRHPSSHLLAPSRDREVGKRKTKAALVMDKKREKELLQYRITK